MSRSNPGEMTLLLSNIQDPSNLEALMNLIYVELYRMAKHRLHEERPGPTLGPTVLVNETCISLLPHLTTFQNRKHLFGAAARQMRRLLVDRARRHHAQKRGRNWRRVEFEAAERIGFERSRDLLDLDAALARLTSSQPKLARVVELHIFGGYSHPEMATILGISPATARKWWSTARNWLRRELASQAEA